MEGKGEEEKGTQAAPLTAPWRELSGKGHSKLWGTFTRSGLRLGLPPHTDGPIHNHGEDCWPNSCAENHHWHPPLILEQSLHLLFYWKPRSQSPEEECGNTQSWRCFKSSVMFPQSVFIWGAMSSARVGPLFFIKSRVNAAVYQNILKHFMLPSGHKLYGDADFIFQQDLPPVLTAKRTKTWFSRTWDYCAWLASKLAWP